MTENPEDHRRALLASRERRKLGELNQSRGNLAANKEVAGPYHDALKSAVQIAEEEHAAAAALVDAHDKAHGG